MGVIDWNDAIIGLRDVGAYLLVEKICADVQAGISNDPEHYLKKIEEIKRCKQVLWDVTELLKIQKPKIMTPEEIYDSIINNKRISVYLQTRDGICRIPRPALYTNLYGTDSSNHLCLAYADITGFLEQISLYTNKYGIEWVFWTANPSDEQRKAVKWDGRA